MFKNWKSSLAGLGAIILGVAKVVSGDLSSGVTSVIAGVGLLMAKDFDVTGTPDDSK